MTFAIVTGLAREARIAVRAGLRVACAGPGPEMARRASVQLIDGGASCLVSFGYAAGLDPRLTAGDLVVADRVLTSAGESWRSDEAEGLADRLGGARLGALLGSDAPIATVPAKAALAGMAIAVDMESHAVASVAAARGVPFLVVRAIADPADRVLPDAALDGISPDGRLRLGRLLAALAVRPGDIGAIVELARAAQKADRALTRAAANLAGA